MIIYDFAIVGAGIAGASLSAELADHASVLVLEGEDQPGYHATGRSAAFWEECYGGPEIVPLTLASGPYLREHGFLTNRGALYIGREEDRAQLDEFERRFSGTGASFERLDQAGLEARLPGLQPAWRDAIWEPACADINVSALHAHYLKLGKARGVDLEVRARLVSATRSDEQWDLRTADGEYFKAKTLVNAAGAWADGIAEMAGARPIGITPLRRTVVQIRTNPAPPDTLPLVLDINGDFYFKPEAGRLWLSPHDETPSDPCDAAPEELDVALALDRFTNVCNWYIEAVEHRWAGLRSFASDRLPVYGYDPQCPGFAWFAGQGGYGIQTSPAAARLAAQLLLGRERDEMTRSIDAVRYSPQRFV
ncbi:NAD(P)/FAD-dependent oxidoreductase [Qipengyuania sp. DGS5-3]|uniref:NAD(P)/FAD-dependent oxidoreductase n=1 Tax=Qipengyuania sp. DGS5-3 TaxID=3349632 RepID=UPI0036D2A9F9